MSDALRSKPIAIKFGSSTSTNSKPSASSRSKPQPSRLGKRPRSSAWGGDDDDDGSGSDSDGQRGRHEKITGFGEDGAETSSNKRRRDSAAGGKKTAYIIERQPNKDWKSEARAAAATASSATNGGRRNLLPPEARVGMNGSVVETEPADQDKPIKWGLNVTGRKSPAGQDAAEASAHQEDTPAAARESGSPSGAMNGTSSSRTHETPSIDEQAILRLRGEEPEETRTIPSEADALQRDLATAGEASTLADYEAMPIEEFGAALLRGMGWNGEERGPKVKEAKRRPNRLGLGAKELKGDEELGGWNQGKKKDSNRRPKLSEYRREEEKRREKRREGREDSYKRERESEREHERSRRHRDGYKNRDREYDRNRRR